MVWVSIVAKKTYIWKRTCTYYLHVIHPWLRRYLGASINANAKFVFRPPFNGRLLFLSSKIFFPFAGAGREKRVSNRFKVLYITAPSFLRERIPPSPHMMLSNVLFPKPFCTVAVRTAVIVRSGGKKEGTQSESIPVSRFLNARPRASQPPPASTKKPPLDSPLAALASGSPGEAITNDFKEVWINFAILRFAHVHNPHLKSTIMCPSGWLL